MSIVALTIASCSSTAGVSVRPTAAPTGMIVSGHVTDAALTQLFVNGALDQQRLAALIAEVRSLPADQQFAVLNDTSQRAELEAANVSGLTAAAGGAVSAEATLKAAWSTVAKDVAGVDVAALLAAQPTSTVRPAGFQAPRAASPSANGIGAIGMFLGMFALSSLVNPIVSAANSFAPDRYEEHVDNGTTITGAVEESRLEMAYDGKEKDVDVKFKTVAVVHPCPDADGKFDIQASITTQASLGNTGSNASIELNITGTVNDNADLVEKNVENHIQWAEFGGGKGQYVDLTFSGPSGLDSTKVNRTGGNVTNSMVSLAAIIGGAFGSMVAGKLIDAAEQAWKSGRCVQFDTTASPGPTGMKPSGESNIKAKLRSKVQPAPVTGTITATMSAGGEHVEPSSTPLPSPAEFTYTAPSEKDKTGTVALEGRSKRGIAKASIDFDTKQKGYTASYTGGGITITGAVPDLAATFTTTGTFPGGTGTFVHTPTDDHSGTIVVSGGGSGAVMTGSGTYTIADNGDGTLTMTEKIHACIDVSGVCNDNVQPVLLTPT